MNYLKHLSLVVIAVAALTALTAPASATTPTSPKGTVYTGATKGESTNLTLDGAFVTVSCKKSTAEATITQHGSSVTAGSKLSSLTFSECNYAVTVNSAGTAEVHAKGTLTSSGISISVATSVGTCVFTTNFTDMGAGTDSTETGGNLILDFNSAKIPRTGGNFLCGASATLTGTYRLTTPSTLFLD